MIQLPHIQSLSCNVDLIVWSRFEPGFGMPIQMLSFLLNLTGEITLKNCNNTSDKLATDRLKTNCYEFHFFLYCTTLLVHVTHVHCLVFLILLLSDSPRFYMTRSDSRGCATIMHDSYGLLVTRSLSRTDQWLQYKYGRILKHVP